MTMARTAPSLSALRAKRAAAATNPPAAPKPAPVVSIWNAELDERLRILAPDYSAAQIAAMLGVSRNAVIGRCHRRNIALAGAQKKAAARRAEAKLRPPRRERKVQIKREKDMIAPDGADPSVYISLAERREAAMVAPSADWQPARIGLMDLREDTCRWPLWIGIVPFSEKFYCGSKALPGNAYCSHCHRLSVTAPHVAAAVDRRIGFAAARAA